MKRLLFVILSALILCSVFTGLGLTASAADISIVSVSFESNGI